MTAGTGPLGTLQLDPRIQDRKEMRLKEIQKWLVEEKDTSRKLSKDMTDKEVEFRRDFDMDVILAQRERCMRKQEMLTEMFTKTAQTEGKLYGDDPATEWILEFRLKWEKCGGTELDKKVNEEYTKQGLRLKQALNLRIFGGMLGAQLKRIHRGQDLHLTLHHLCRGDPGGLGRSVAQRRPEGVDVVACYRGLWMLCECRALSGLLHRL